MYLDMRKYGLDKFEFEILEEVEADSLKETEQHFIETLKPTYNQVNANGMDIERHKEYQKGYEKSEKCKEYRKEYHKEYYNQLCLYNCKKLTLKALSERFRRAGISNPTQEAKKYLIKD